MQIDSHIEQRRYMRHLCIIAVVVVCVTVGVLRILQADSEPAVASPTSEARPAGSSSSSGSEPSVGRDDPGLIVAENHELIVNAALLDLINSFLLRKTDDDRADQLRIYLKSELPSPAYGEAERIVETLPGVHESARRVARRSTSRRRDGCIGARHRTRCGLVSAARPLAAKHTGRYRRAGVVPER
ncbi:hypothetical protein QFZ97_007258 [Paraburkholderia youngii]